MSEVVGWATGWAAGHSSLCWVSLVVVVMVVAEVALRLRARRATCSDGSSLRKSGFSKTRELRVDGYVVVPFTTTLVRCGEEGVVRAVPPAGVKLCYLVVPRLAAMDMEIVSLRVGKNNQIASEGAVPADVFAGSLHLWGFPGETDRVKSVALDFPVPLDLDDPEGRDVELRVWNMGPQTRNFTAVMFGKRISERRI